MQTVEAKPKVFSMEIDEGIGQKVFRTSLCEVQMMPNLKTEDRG